MTALCSSVLLFGAPLYACLSDRSMVFEASNGLFREAERMFRHFVRWALRPRSDMRSSALYLFSNSTTL